MLACVVDCLALQVGSAEGAGTANSRRNGDLKQNLASLQQGDQRRA